jgi:uncharacterized protein YndB with AHSA1/START domain
MENSKKLKISPRGERELEISQEFDSSRENLFRAYTEPELLKQWLLGPPGWSMPVCEVDLRVGGSYRYVWRNSSGEEMSVSGVYREIVAPEKIVNTELFDQPWYPGESLITVHLSEKGGRTRLSAIIEYESKEARDGVVKSPMEEGLAASYEKLAKLLASMSHS